ncbi:MAG: hypothetical protein KIT14_19625 [bacterium]|nr:hypothetical protein [bacterium]
MTPLALVGMLAVLLLATPDLDAKPRAASRSACRAACDRATAACVASAGPATRPRAERRCRHRTIRRCMRVGLGECPPPRDPAGDPDPCQGVPNVLGTWQGPTLSCEVVCSDPVTDPDGIVVEPCEPPVAPVQSLVVAWQDCRQLATDRASGVLGDTDPVRFTIAPPSISDQSSRHWSGIVSGETLTDVELWIGTPLLVRACRTRLAIGPMTRVAAD